MKINQTGRSMVEMLGVLAIVGILSVGSIAGYSKAMNKYKMNKQITQISQIISYIGYHHPLTKVSPRISIIPMLKKLGVIPKEMIKDNDENYIYDIFNNKIEILDGVVANWGAAPNKATTSVNFYANITKDNTAKQTCANLFGLIKEYHNSIWYVELVSTANGSTVQVFASFYGDKYCSEDNCLKDLDVAKSIKFCSAVVEETGRNLSYAYSIKFPEE